MEELWYIPDFDNIAIAYLPNGWYGKVFIIPDDVEDLIRRYSDSLMIDPIKAGWIKLAEYTQD